MSITIRETKEKDLNHLKQLWNDGDVMYYVGFPQGLGTDDWQMSRWYERLQAKEQTKHYCVYEKDLGFVGETYFSWEDCQDPAIIDIKLLAKARGKKIAFRALSFCLDQLFRLTKSQVACVDPDSENIPAIKLYQSLGFQEKHRFVDDNREHVYMELGRENWQTSRLNAIQLVSIDRSNYMDILRLKVNKDQMEFVATNAVSLAQSKYQEELVPKAIYSFLTPVGFVMYCMDSDDQEYWIYRLMVDEHFQGLGYGKKALELTIEEIKKHAINHLIRISFEPANHIAKECYESLGFRNTGRFDGDEIIYELTW